MGELIEKLNVASGYPENGVSCFLWLGSCYVVHQSKFVSQGSGLSGRFNFVFQKERGQVWNL